MVVERQHIVGTGSPVTTVCRNINSKRVRAIPSLNIYRPPAARRSEGHKEPQAEPSPDATIVTKPEKVRTPKQRRPDIQVYVPRAKRASAGELEIRSRQAQQNLSSGFTLRQNQPVEHSSTTDFSFPLRRQSGGHLSHRTATSQPINTSAQQAALATEDVTTLQPWDSKDRTSVLTSLRRPLVDPSRIGRSNVKEEDVVISSGVGDAHFPLSFKESGTSVTSLQHQPRLKRPTTDRRVQNSSAKEEEELTFDGCVMHLLPPSREHVNSVVSEEPPCLWQTVGVRRESLKEEEDKDVVNSRKSRTSFTLLKDALDAGNPLMDVKNKSRISMNNEEAMISVDEGISRLPFYSRDSSKYNLNNTKLSENSAAWDKDFMPELLVVDPNCSGISVMDSCAMDDVGLPQDSAWPSSVDNTPGQSGTSSPAPINGSVCGTSGDCWERLGEEREFCEETDASIIYESSCSTPEITGKFCKEPQVNLMNGNGDCVRSITDEFCEGTNNYNEQSEGEKSLIGVRNLDIISNTERECKKDIDEDCRKGEEQNRKNRRIVRNSFMSDVLIISDQEPVDTKLAVASIKGDIGGVVVKKTKMTYSREEEHTPEAKKPSPVNLNPNECTWDMMFDDSGECLDPKLMDELTSAVGSVAIEKPQSDYSRYQNRGELPLPVAGDEFAHVLEIYNFPPEFKTQDLLTVFSPYKNGGFEIKWVDDTHALGVFSSSLVAAEVLAADHPFVKTRPLREATHESRTKARRSAEFLQPYRARPETCPALARRLVTGALGVRLSTSREEREAERRLLKEAREKKKMAARQRDEAWEGTLGEK